MSYRARTKYDAPKAAFYREVGSDRRALENAILADLLARLDRETSTILDVPCGTARAVAALPADGVYTGADLSAAMLAEGRARLEAEPSPRRWRLVRCDAERLPFADCAFDGVLCLRFLHHLAPEIRDRVLAELARVASAWVVVTHFRPLSAHGLERRAANLVRKLRGRPTIGRHSVATRSLARIMEHHGFVLRESRSSGFLRELAFAVFERAEGARR